MPQFRKSFKHSINDTVYVLWDDKFTEAVVSEIHIAGVGVHYTVKNYEGKYRMFHESKVGKNIKSLVSKLSKTVNGYRGIPNV